ncbi:hypothetical protein LTR85_010581 [Meristemomyces frigidus]|nr:hypothetical protein LTR85_010581 [Meristemomyces frigidus]
MDIFEGAVGISYTTIERTEIRPPSDNAEAKQLREDIFVYQTFRRRMVAAVQTATDQEYILVKKLFVRERVTDKGAADKLEILEDMKEGLRDCLHAGTAEAVGSPKSSFDNREPSYLASNEAAPSVEDVSAQPLTSKADQSSLSVDEQVALINKNPPADIMYYANEKASAQDIISCR